MEDHFKEKLEIQCSTHLRISADTEVQGEKRESSSEICGPHYNTNDIRLIEVALAFMEGGGPISLWESR